MQVFSFRFCLFYIFAIAFLLLQADGKASGGNDMPTKKWNGMEWKGKMDTDGVKRCLTRPMFVKVLITRLLSFFILLFSH